MKKQQQEEIAAESHFLKIPLLRIWLKTPKEGAGGRR
jgi:hypothetical protein